MGLAARQMPRLFLLRPRSERRDARHVCVQHRCDTNSGDAEAHFLRCTSISPSHRGVFMLRAFFIALSESKSLRGVAERSAIGQRMSSRFVAGTQVEDALRATQAINQMGASV